MMISKKRSTRDTTDPRMTTHLRHARRPLRGVRKVGAKATLEIVARGRSDLEVIAYGCGRCGQVYDFNYIIGPKPDRMAHARGLAMNCCENKCVVCQTPTKRFHSNCQECADHKQADRRRQWAARATPCTLDETDWVYCEGYGYQDGYFSEFDELVEWCCDEGVPLPSYVHPCEPVVVKVDPVDIYERIDDQVSTEESATERLNGCEALEAAIEAFNKQNAAPFAWEADLSRVIILDAKAFNKEFGSDAAGRPVISWRDQAPTVDAKTVSEYQRRVAEAMSEAAA